MAKSSVNSNLPDEEDNEMVEGDIGIGSTAAKASVSSAMVLSLEVCAPIMLIRNSHLADYSSKGSRACAKYLIEIIFIKILF